MDLGQNGVARLTLNEAHNGVLVAGAHQRIAFPMPDLEACLNIGRPLRNSSSTNDLTTSFPPAPIALATLLLASQMAPKFAATGFVSVDMAVERLMADGDFCGNLFWAQLVLQMPYSR